MQRRRRWQFRWLEDEVTMAAGYGVDLISPLTDPGVARMIAPTAGDVGHAIGLVGPGSGVPRLLLREATDPEGTWDWQQRRNPPADPTRKTLAQGRLRAAERFERLLAGAPTPLWDFLRPQVAERLAELCRDAAGEGGRADSASRILADALTTACSHRPK